MKQILFRCIILTAMVALYSCSKSNEKELLPEGDYLIKSRFENNISGISFKYYLFADASGKGVLQNNKYYLRLKKTGDGNYFVEIPDGTGRVLTKNLVFETPDKVSMGENSFKVTFNNADSTYHFQLAGNANAYLSHEFNFVTHHLRFYQKETSPNGNITVNKFQLIK